LGTRPDVRLVQSGIYFGDRLAVYEAEKLRDRNGNLVPSAPFNLLGLANVFGLSYTRKISGNSLFLTLTAGGPIAQLKLDIGIDPDWVSTGWDSAISISNPSD
jgi:hypothetical protein